MTRPTNPNKSLIRLRESWKLDEVRLIDAIVKQRLKKGPLPTKIEVRSKAEVLINQVESFVVFSPVLAVVARYDSSSETDAPLMIQAEYRLRYSLSAGQTMTSNPEIQKFVEAAGMVHVWPFFREFVHSMMGRMGLPSLVIPHFDPSDFSGRVVDEIATKKASTTQVGRMSIPRRDVAAKGKKRKAKSNG